MRSLTISFRFPLNRFHGGAGQGKCEWPPSPLRVFQALVNAAANRWRGDEFAQNAVPMLEWLEAQAPPSVVAPVGRESTVYRNYVPDNVGDEVGRSWVGGGDKSIAGYRTEKDVRGQILPDDGSISYFWPVADGGIPDGVMDRLRTAVRSISHLGWGVDMVVSDAALIDAEEEKVIASSGERWLATSADGGGFRVPVTGTLADLRRRYGSFLARVDGDTFRPVPPLLRYRTVGYRRAGDSADVPVVAFELRHPEDFRRFRAFVTSRRTLTVAGMVRNLVGVAAAAMRPFGWDDERISHFVHGHTPDGDRVRGGSAGERLSYLPLPTLESRGSAVPLSKRHVGMIRRVLLTGPSQCAEWVRWTRVLAGELLYADEKAEPGTAGEPRAVLKLIDLPPRGLREDANVGPYVGRGRTWSTVTPVVLPGYDDNRAAKTLGLLRKSFVQAGVSEESVAGAEIRFRGVGYRPGQDLARDYEAPGKSSGPKYQVWVRFPVEVTGPLAVGKLRYRGLGLFALVEDETNGAEGGGPQ